MENSVYFVSNYVDGENCSEVLFMAQDPSAVMKFVFGNDGVEGQKPSWIKNTENRQYALVWQMKEGFSPEKRLMGVWGDAARGKTWQKFLVDEDGNIFFDGCTVPKANALGPNFGLLKSPDQGEGVPSFPMDMKEYINAIGKAYGH